MTPDDVEKYQHLESVLRRGFRLWGYREVRTSTMDYFDVIRGGTGEGFADSIFKVQDSDGKLLSMRGEVTTQIARMLASTARDQNRLCYITNCLRFLESKSYSQREYWQAGAELLGGEPVASDAEVIAMILTLFESLGLNEIHIDIGNVALFKRLAERYRIKDYNALVKAVQSKSATELIKITEDPEARKAFTFIMSKRGGEEIIENLAEIVGDLYKEKAYFNELFSLLQTYGVAGKVSVDLGTLREFKYYNGTVFEIYLGGFGVPIGGGGRYDALMEEFGLSNTAATGFAVSVDMCVKALESSGFKSKEEQIVRIFYKDGFREKAVKKAIELRNSGKPCVVCQYRNEKIGILIDENISELNGAVENGK